jgi:hypothetical protein
MKRATILTVTVLVPGLLLTTLAMAEPYRQVLQAPEMQTPGQVLFYPADLKTSGTLTDEHYGIAPHREEKTVPRTPVQQSPEMQTPGVVETSPAGGI